MPNTNKSKKPGISVTQVKSYLGCTRAWDWRYNVGLSEKITPLPLYKGTVLHRLLEERSKGGSWKDLLQGEITDQYNALSGAQMEILGDNFIGQIFHIMNNYDFTYGETDKWEVVELEGDICVPLLTTARGATRANFIGKIDGIVKSPDGDLYVLERKTFKNNKMSREQTWINLQSAAYVKACWLKGLYVRGVIWDMIRSTPPEPLKVLKSGAFGKQYEKQTLYSALYLERAFPSREVIPIEVFDDIKDNGKSFLDRYIVDIDEGMMERIWANIQTTATQIISKKTIPVHNLNQNCDWCVYKELCQTELFGGDVDSVIDLLFNRREYKSVATTLETPADGMGGE